MITEQVFDVVNVNLTNKKIYMTRIGYGNDREFSFEENPGLIENVEEG